MYESDGKYIDDSVISFELKDDDDKDLWEK